MDKMDNDQENLDLLIKINKGVKSQRKLSDELGYSLGKLNYCLKALKYKGLIKIKNFRNNENKLNYM
jgi:biotin operon repressor